ncbi:MAG: hypothetical protein ACFE0Q_06965 [Anaerolineae bacterium]
MSVVVFVLGCGIIFNLRARNIGEDGASLAMYFLGTFFILTMTMMLWAGKFHSPEALGLKLSLAAVILTGAWVNIEEKVVMPILSADCEQACVMHYDRVLPFSDSVTVYTESRGWKVLD